MTTVRRGRNTPTSVWILSRKRRDGRMGYRLRWISRLTGKTESEACGTDKVYARSRREEKRLELRGILSGSLPDHTLDELIQAVPGFKAGKSPNTIRVIKTSIEALVRLCGDRLLARVDRAFIMDFRAKRLAEGVSPATCNKQLREIKSALSDAVDAGWLHTNPLWRWKAMQVREPEKRVRIVERDEFTKLLEAAVLPEFRALLVVAYHAGLRREELCNLRWDAVNFDRGLLHVENRPEDGEFTKTRKNRALPMHREITTALRRLHEASPRIVTGGILSPKRPHVFGWDDGRPFKPDWVTRQFAKIAEAAGVKTCHLHDLRRSFSTMAQRAGVDVGTVTDLGGWSTTSVVKKHYTGELPEAFTKAMKKIEAAEAVA